MRGYHNRDRGGQARQCFDRAYPPASQVPPLFARVAVEHTCNIYAVIGASVHKSSAPGGGADQSDSAKVGGIECRVSRKKPGPCAIPLFVRKQALEPFLAHSCFHYP
ncbi:MAG: hypothetical protein HYU64_00080 [Armatimonadetes bacterium]|nr:hypothetical protein [Armatimonadota bacterium]